MSDGPQRGVLPLLSAQAFAFGVTLALLVVPANALFLDAYGSKWLPMTYIAIAVFGSAASALIGRAARRTRLVTVATATLLALAVSYAVSWVILLAGGVWVSALLLVLFPIALQIGFVFIGGQAGRLLDVRQLKERFPRIVAGFASGFLLGGLLGIPLLALLGSTEHLLVATTIAQLTFLVLLVATERRFPEERAAPDEGSLPVPRPPARELFGSRFVLLLLSYQILSAMGSWLLDFLLFNRASARYSGDSLTRFLSGYTALLNLADILFVALLAAVLMRRFGLRLGLVLNPAVVAILLAATASVVAGPGAAVFAVFLLAAAARLADIVLTDGTTRTSVNASFQIIPLGERLAVQAIVEGVGVPLAIGAIGVVLLAANLAGLGIGAVIVFGVVLSVVWTGVGALMYRSYTRALAAEVGRRLLDPAQFDLAGEEEALHALLVSPDARDVRLGLELVPGVPGAVAGALRQAATHADPEVRVDALARGAAAGDEEAAVELSETVERFAASSEPAERRAAAAAFAHGVLGDRRALVPLLDDTDPTVRAAAIDSVRSADADDPLVVSRVVAALDEPRLGGYATAALEHLGARAVPLLAAALARERAQARRPLIRAIVAAAPETAPSLVSPLVSGSDRVAVLGALEALAALRGSDAVAPDVLDRVFDDAQSHAARAAVARSTLSAFGDSLRRALDDEIELSRRLVIAVLTLRHGDRLRDAIRTAERADGQRRALGIEALDVLLSRSEAAAIPLICGDVAVESGPAVLEPEALLHDLVEDPEEVWRSSWLTLCAADASPARA